MLKNGQDYFKNFAVFTPKGFLKCVWSLFNIMNDIFKKEKVSLCENW